MDVYPSQAKSLLCRLDNGLPSRDLAEYLHSKYRLLIKDLSGMEGLPQRQYIRLAVREHKDDDRLLAALAECQVSMTGFTMEKKCL